MVLPTIGSESFPRTKRFDMKERLALVHNAKMRTKGVRSRSRAESAISRGEPHLGDIARTTESHPARSTDAAHAPSLARQVDVAALEAQIAEKAARKRAEIEYDRCAPRPRARLPIAVGRPSRSTTDDDADGSPSLAPRRHHDKMASFIDKKLVVLEQERREVQAALNRNVADFRREHQVRAHHSNPDVERASARPLGAAAPPFPPTVRPLAFPAPRPSPVYSRPPRSSPTVRPPPPVDFPAPPGEDASPRIRPLRPLVPPRVPPRARGRRRPPHRREQSSKVRGRGPRRGRAS